MVQSGHRWQLVVFVGAILVPSLVLVLVGQRTIQQNRELAGKRRLDEQRAAKERISRELLARLEAIKRAAARNPEARPDFEVAFVARVDSGRMVPPWESDPWARRFRQISSRPAFAAAIGRGEQAEYAGRNPETAIGSYREAIQHAEDPGQTAYARLLIARALDKQGRKPEALAEARQLLNTPVDVVDEDGVPLRVHAAALLVASQADREAIRQALNAVLDARSWQSPIATFALSNLADQLESAVSTDDREWIADFRSRIAGALRFQEQVHSLQNDAARLGILAAPGPGGRPTWTLYSGSEPWLVSADFGPGGSPVVIAARAHDVFRPFEAAGTLRFLPSTEPGGELLSDSFPGVKVRYAPADTVDTEGYGLQNALYLFALFFIVAATAFGATLLWRSLRREMQLAETRSQFVASVSHELKTPLTAIRMFAETLQMRRTPDEHVQDEYLETIVNECERLSRLVDDVLLFSKIEQGKKAYRFRPVSLVETLRAASRALSYPLSQHGFELETNVEEDVSLKKADPDAIEQALLNLLTNAMKYSGDNRRITLRLARQDGEALIEVTDYGLGIALEQQERIFEKYYRAPTRENQTIPGTGLGLTLVAQIAKAHNGRVEVLSTPGHGSTFTLHLPIGNEP